MMRATCLALLFVGLLTSAVLADNPLNLTQDYPDIATFDLDASYVYDSQSGTGVFTASTSNTVANGGGDFSETGATNITFFSQASFQVTVDANGDLVADPGNQMSIYCVGSFGGLPPATMLLAGDIVDFGWSTNANGTLGNVEFRIALTTLYSAPGVFENYPDPTGLLAGSIMGVGGNAFTGWTSDFTAATIDTAADTFIPEPMSLALLGSGILLGWRRRRTA